MKLLFWNVDTQKDFMNKDGALYVKESETIKPVLKQLTELAEKGNIKVVNTMDLHTPGSEELSESPDYKTTFPPHCLVGTDGMKYIEEVIPSDKKAESYWVSWLHKEIDIEKLENIRNIVITKDKFNVFEGNNLTDKIVEHLKPEQVVVYGVATEVCVDFAVRELIKREIKVTVILDAIKGLAKETEEKTIEAWKELGVELKTLEEITKVLVPEEKPEDKPEDKPEEKPTEEPVEKPENKKEGE